MRYKKDYEHPCSKFGMNIDEVVATLRAEADQLEKMARAGIQFQALGIGPPCLYCYDAALAKRFDLKEEPEQKWIASSVAPPVKATDTQQDRPALVRNQVAEYLRGRLRGDD